MEMLWRGAGISEFTPLIDFHISSLLLWDGTLSGMLQFHDAHSAAPIASAGFFSSSGYLFRRRSYGVRSGVSVKHVNIGWAFASNWVIGGIPRISSTVLSMLTLLIDNNLLFGRAGRVIIFGPIAPSTTVKDDRSRHPPLSRTAWESRDVAVETPARLEAPKINRTSPPGQRENHDKYSVEASAAVKTS